jgi:hypothetical protein
MRDLTDVRIRRGLLVLAAVSLCLALAGPAIAKTEKINFVPGTDISSWYWERQVDEEVTTPIALPPPAPPASQRVRLPSPQRPDTLPVALNQGNPERMSAIRFDLLERGVTDGSQIKKLILFIEESTDRNEHPQVSPEQAKIKACLILDYLPQGENERFKDAPKFDDADCVDGTRDAPAGSAAVWTFDLTKLADVWGKRSFDNNGVMLIPTVEAGKTWQVNLKVPQKEATAQEGDQYELTKNRAFITIDFIPGEPLKIAPLTTPTDTTTSTAPSTGGSTGSIPSSFGGASGSPLVSPSTDLAGTGAASGETAPAPVPTEQAGFAVPQEQGPRMPAYVWLAIPLGLLALSAVRSVILEPVGGPRPDGVIAAIRRRNAERRGGVLGERTGFLAGVAGGLRRRAGGIGRAFSGVTKTVRRKR